MQAELLHIYGPISIQWYGLMIFIGIIVFCFAFLRDTERKKIVTTEQFFDLMTLGILAGIIGGRLLFVITNWDQIHSFYNIIALWEPGFSILGSIIGILLVIPFYLRAKKINSSRLFDLAALYAPLLQAISRIGCFFAGCCYGCQSNLPWAVSDSCTIYRHPTQIYSALVLVGIFFILYRVRELLKKPGQLAMIYLILESVERFVVDFWRGDREFFAGSPLWSLFSVHQYIALGLGAVALIILYRITVRAAPKHESF